MCIAKGSLADAADCETMMTTARIPLDLPDHNAIFDLVHFARRTTMANDWGCQKESYINMCVGVCVCLWYFVYCYGCGYIE